MSPGRPGRFAQACLMDRASGDKERRKHGAAQGGEAAVAARRPQLRCRNNRFSVGRVRQFPPPPVFSQIRTPHVVVSWPGRPAGQGVFSAGRG
ncbi:hypothetical protein NDU88_008037 [Pleurodeles waltl]|uniref:Uncharacterized protein n=1 Tax=Pleurodeles waltl TaxID=8319 RepID=A0AAV7VUL2_PLEWA|nr:hypothetical protein NDU88_008037 [Pleurodeles waltl]